MSDNSYKDRLRDEALAKKAIEQSEVQEWNQSKMWKSFYKLVAKIIPNTIKEQNKIKKILPF